MKIWDSTLNSEVIVRYRLRQNIAYLVSPKFEILPDARVGHRSGPSADRVGSGHGSDPTFSAFNFLSVIICISQSINQNKFIIIVPYVASE